MRLSAVLSCVIGVFLPAAAPAAESDESDEELFRTTCSRCHSIGDYIMGERTRKGWELTVKRMQAYYGAKEFTDAEADRIAAYLATHTIEPEKWQPQPYSTSPAPVDYYEPSPATPSVAIAPAPASPATQPAAATRPAPRRPVRARMPFAKPKLWKPPGRMLAWARHLGYLAVALLAVMVVMGIFRRKIGRHFRRLHLVFAAALFVSVMVHCVVFLAEYGTPPVLWLWFGIAAMGVVLATQVHGLARPRLGRLFLKVHVAGAVVGLTATVLHWVWFYL